MSLTYSQKRFIQNEYQHWSAEEIAKKLNIQVADVQAHIDKFYKTSNPKKVKQPDSHVPPVIEQIPFVDWLRDHWINLVVLLFFVVAVYFNGLTSELVSDDIPAIKDIGDKYKNIMTVFEIPSFMLRMFQYYIAYQIGGITPIFYRLFNLGFHIGVVFMVYVIVPFFTKKRLMPFLVASIVAVHPMMIESVTWISGGIYAQAAFFLLVSLFLYIKYRTTDQTRYVIFSGISFICALSGSEKVIIYPGILLAYEFTFHKLWRTWIKTLPFVLISFGWLLIILGRVNERIQYLETIGSLEYGKNIYNPLEQVPAAVGSYMMLLFWPDKLTLYHSEFRLNLVQFATLAAIFLIYLAVTIFMYRKNKSIFFWLVFFFITLIPTMNPVGLSWIVAERYVYLGSIGVYFTVAYAIVKLIESKKFQTIGYILITIILVGLSVRTILRNMDWRNQDTLWIATGKTSPSDPKTHNNLGDVYARRNDYKLAAQEFATAIKLNPKYPDAYYNLGNLYRTLKKYDEALPLFKKTIELNPGVWQAYQNIAVIEYDRGNVDEAHKHIIAALKISPDNSTLHSNLGIIYIKIGDTKSAVEELKKAVILDPKNDLAKAWLQKLLSEPEAL